MAKGKIKRPRYKALPKAPKMSASLDVWKRYERRVTQIMSENLKKKAEYDKIINAIKSINKQKESIKNKVSTAKAKLYARI